MVVINNQDNVVQSMTSIQEPMMQMPILQQPVQGAVYANQDQSFLKWLFSFREESVVPLKNAWMGKEFDYTIQKWVYPANKKNINPLMNEKGIDWGISLIESYFSPVFLTTDFTVRTYNFRMRQATRVIIFNICRRYKEFGIDKNDIRRVAEEIESKISAILQGAINDGYRRFFSTQNSYSEVKNLSEPSQQNKQSIFAGISKVFRKEQPQQMQGGY